MAIAIPPPQRGKHCNTITTSTPAVPPVITTNVLSCATGSYNPRTGIVTKIQAFGVQTNTVSCNSTAKKLYLNFTLLRIRGKQSVKTTEIQPNCERNATAAA